MKNDNTQNIQIAKIETDVCWLKREVASIKRRVGNDIPHQIENLRDNFNSYKSTQSKWLVGILITLVFTLIGVLANLIK
jgi:hypothetical protein